MFERLRDAVNAALDAATPPPDWRDLRGQMHRAAVEGRAALAKMRDDLSVTEEELAVERRRFDDARRRGRLAGDIEDLETVEVAGRFEAKHEERVAVLEQKVAAQQAELALAERDIEDMVEQLKEVERRGRGPATDPAGTVAADLPDAGGARLREDIDRAAREADADARLRELKKRMGK